MLTKPGTKKAPSRGVLLARKRKAEQNRLAKENDVMWSMLVKLRAGNKTEKPATPQELAAHPSRQLNSHHFLRKQKYPCLRWDLRDGICIYAWQHVMARGSAHDDPPVFDAWAIPYMARRGDLAYLNERKERPGHIGPIETAEANKALREVYRAVTGREFWGATQTTERRHQSER
jgi:hypothetical protein